MIHRINYFVQDFKVYLLLLFFTSISVLIVLCKKPSNIVVSIIAAITTVIFIFVGGEAYLRYIFDQSDGIGFLKIAQKWHSRHVMFNGNFRRDKEFTTTKRKEETRIAVMGDSITFGIGIENPQNRFSNLVEKKLLNDGYDVSIYNLGISGVNTNEEIEDFGRMNYLDFDILIWQYYLNDANISTQSANAQILINKRQEFERQPIIKLIIRNSYLLDFLYWRFSSIYDRTFTDLAAEDLSFYQDPAKFPLHKTTITNFISELRKADIPVIVLIFPLLQTDTIRQESQNEYDLVKSIFVDASPNTIIDLSLAYKPYSTNKLKASRFDQHPNEFAHQIAADLLYKKVKPLLP